MRIHDLHLIAFGPFTDRHLDFNREGGGLQLIYGPNEAGKSSALRAIDALLFGIPVRTTDNFLHSYGELRIGARLVNEAGRELHFVRRKRQRKSLVQFDDHDATIPENALDDFLKGVQRETFLRLHGINHDELRSGGERMRGMNGLLGESLFAASLGGSGLADVLEKLDEQARDLHGKRSGRIRSAIKDYQAARGEKLRAEVTGKTWKTLKDEYETVLARKSAVVQRQTELEAQQRRLERLRDALPKISEWKRLKELFDGQSPFILPSSYSTEERSRCDTMLVETKRQLERVREKQRSQSSQLAALTDAPTLLAFADEIHAMLQHVGHQRELTEQLRQAEHDRELGADQVSRLLKEMDADVDLNETASLAVRREHRAAIQDLAAKEEQRRSAVDDLRQKSTDVSCELDATERHLSGDDPSDRLTTLTAAMQEAIRHETLDHDLGQAQRKLTELQEQLDHGLRELPWWSSNLQTLGDVTPPPREVSVAFEDRFQQLTRRRETLDATLSDKQGELASTRQALRALLEAGRVYSEEDLRRARQERSETWKRLRREWRGEKQASRDDEPLDERLDQQIEFSDEVADRLRREADRVARHAQHRAAEQRLESEISRLEERTRQIETEQQELQNEWTRLWDPVGLTEVRSPREMLPWLERRHQLVELSLEFNQQRDAVDRLEALRARCTEQLRRALGDARVQLPDPNSFAALKVVTQDTLTSVRQQLARREQLTKEQFRLTLEQEKLREQLEQAQQQLADWQARWARAMQWISMPTETSSAQAIERLRCAEELQAAHLNWERAGQRVQHAQEEMNQFGEEVRDLARRALPEFATLPVMEITGALKDGLEKSQREDQAANDLLQRQREQQEEIDQLEDQARDLELQLEQYMDAAGVESSSELAKVETLSRQATRMRDLEQELVELSGNIDLDAFVTQAEGLDAAELEAQISQLAREIDDEDAQRDAIVEQLTEVKSAMDEVDGSDEAALADQLAMSHLAQIHADTRHYLRLRIAAAILKRQIERYREENQDPLLAKASSYFAQMTLDEFDGLKPNYDENGIPIIVGVRKSGDELTMSAMSDGTLDPLYLALRLAYLQRRFEQHEPMPFVVDDILIHLDDERALATLRVLAELSSQTQVLFFTHHARLKELAEAHLPSEVVTIHELERRESLSP